MVLRGKKNMRKLVGVALACCGCCVTPVAHAARPMVVDDARIVDAESCQLETWRRSYRDSFEYWALPGCNPTGNLEITLGSAKLPNNGNAADDYSRTVQIQGKTLFRKLETNSYGYGLAVGGSVRPPSLGDQLPNYYAYVPYTRSLQDDRWFVHANLGVQRQGVSPATGVTAGIGTEYAVVPRVFLILETYGDNHSAASYQGGVRVWLVPNHIQIDATVGTQAGGLGANRWFSLGLRLLTPPFLK